MSETRAQLEAWRQQNPGLFRGLQQAISKAEGTWRENQPGYNVLFGGGTFGDFGRHPDRVISSPGGYSSAAAGAYQFMPATYAEAARELGLRDFSPASQDLAMLYKVRQRLMPAGGLAALTKEGVLSPRLQAYLAPEWASFPTATGASAYGQPVKRSSQVSAWFDEGARGASQASRSQETPNASDPRLNYLNKFIELLGISNAIKSFGAQSSVTRPELPRYNEEGSSDLESQLLADLYKGSTKSAEVSKLREEANNLQLLQNKAVTEEAASQLLAQALGSFTAPKSVI